MCLLLTNSITVSNANDKTHSVFTGCSHGSDLGIHHVTVSHTGDTNISCLTGTHPCQSLQFVLDNVMNCTNITVTYNQTLKRPKWFVEPVVGLAIIGDIGDSKSNMVYVECEQGAHAGIGFINSRDVLIRNVAWSGCELQHTTSDVRGNASSALFFGAGANIQIFDSVFHSNHGTGLSLYNVGGHVTISNTTFEKNHPHHSNKTLHCGQVPPDDEIKVDAGRKGGGLYIEHNCTESNSTNSSSIATNYIVQSCFFRFNRNRQVEKNDKLSYSPTGKGGGMAVILIGHCHGYNVTVDNCTFINNSAIWGGALIVEAFGQSEHNNITINNTKFTNNIACKSGGGVHVGMETPSKQSLSVQDTEGTVVHVYSTDFVSNLALHGGGAYLHSNTYRNEILEFAKCTWLKNAANYSGFGSAIALSSPSGTNMVAEFKGCDFIQNYHIVSWTRKFDLDSQGAVYTSMVPLNFSRGPLELGGQGTHFIKNIGTALSVHGTNVSMKDFVTFNSNYGIFGGGVCLTNKASIILNNTMLSFTENFALVHGGAIYAKLPTHLESPHDKTLPCVFHYHSDGFDGSKVRFTKNTVNQRYESIYINNPIGCNNFSWLNDSDVFEYKDPIGAECVITVPYNIKFHDPQNSSVFSDSIEIMVGENFTIFPLVYDKFRHQTQTIAHVELAVGDSPSAPYDDSTYHLIGPNTILMGSHTNDTQFSITGPLPVMNTSNSTDSQPPNLKIVFIVNEDSAFNAHLYVSLVRCKLGYVYDNSTQSCVCDQDSQLNIKCPEPGKACVRYGYWYGSIPGIDSPVIYPCKAQYCHYDNGNCPKRSSPCGLNYCTLTDNPDDICWEGRGGVLCGDCLANYSFTYEAFKCAPRHTCKAGTCLYMQS